jgi:hypothetical protein
MIALWKGLINPYGRVSLDGYADEERDVGLRNSQDCRNFLGNQGERP